MDAIIEKLQSEPALVIGVVVGVLAMVGVKLTSEQTSTLTQVVPLVLALLGAVAVRSKVTPTPKP